MRTIHLLEDTVINKIAAGEVVERPASVVKELVENALDAGATEIRVELEDGGRRRISVIDDGPGMRPEDAALAVVRHATSKIATMDDLVTAMSMGFRGEALASIASVSKFSLITREKNAKSGTRILITGGDSPKVSTEASGASGTTVSVEDLFANVPARQKFLKSATTEYSACFELVQAMSLARPSIGFTVLHNGKETLRAISQKAENGARSGASGDESIGELVLRARAQDVLGKEVSDALVYVARKSAHGNIEALVSPPGLDRGNAKHLHTFINGRWVKDKTLRYGVLRGYHSHLMSGKFPIVVLHVTLDPALVDVNVHPAKTEVRFQYASEIQAEIALAIRGALRHGAWAEIPMAVDLQPTAPTLGFLSAPSSPIVSTSIRRYDGNSVNSDGSSSYGRSSSRDSSSIYDSSSHRIVASNSARSSFSEFASPSSSSFEDTKTSSEDMPSWGNLQFLGAFSRCYLIFADGDRMLVLDQHAFHERIVYERLMRDKTLLQRSQPLLMPESVEVDGAGADVLRQRQNELARVGFKYSVLTDSTVEVSSIPVILAGRDLQSIVAALADPETTDVPTDDASGLAQHLLSTIACHSAVRAGEELGPDELKQLLREAADVDFFLNCPHGRRVFRWWNKAQVAGWFDR